MARWLGAAAVLGALFLVLQAGLWGRLHEEGLWFSTDTYGTLFFSMTGLHALHVAGGLIYLFSVGWRIRGGTLGTGRRSALEFCAAYWHFLGLLWIVLFAVLYFR